MIRIECMYINKIIRSMFLSDLPYANKLAGKVCGLFTKVQDRSRYRLWDQPNGLLVSYNDRRSDDSDIICGFHDEIPGLLA
jgi:hypothetical protein